MKKALKSIFAALLATVIAFGSFAAAFAAEEALEWDYYGETNYHDYVGELAEGANSLTSCDTDENYLFYFTFNAQETGFYEISYSYDDIDGYFFVPETYANGKAVDEKDGLWIETDESSSTNILYYFEKGEQIIGTHLYSYEDDAEISIKYYGESIESIVTDELIIGSEIYFYEGWDEGYIEIYSDVVITFSSGKTVTTNEFYCTVDANELLEGKNTLTANICGKDCDFVIDAVSVTDYIADIKISNIEDYLYVTENYNYYDFWFPYGETVTVTFTDGTTQEIAFEEEYIVLPNGKEVWLYGDVSIEDDECKMNFYVAGTFIKSYDCEMEKASLSNNWSALMTNNAYSLKYSAYKFRMAIATILSCYSMEYLTEYGMEEAAYHFRYSIESFFEIFTEFFRFIRFYVG